MLQEHRLEGIEFVISKLLRCTVIPFAPSLVICCKNMQTCFMHSSISIRIPLVYIICYRSTGLKDKSFLILYCAVIPFAPSLVMRRKYMQTCFTHSRICIRIPIVYIICYRSTGLKDKSFFKYSHIVYTRGILINIKRNHNQ